MAHESFEDEATARVMNENFVCIKVDREERPDIDSIYMAAVQALTGQGGWPMTVFLTPAGEPFFGGTYYPPVDRPGMPSFTRVMQSVVDAGQNRRETITQTSAQIGGIYAAARARTQSEGALTPHALDLAYRRLAQRYDVRHGGFEGAPKFPQAMSLDFLMRYWKRTGMDYALEMVTNSFRQMSRGGLYDQVGGGFHRYTVDAIWLVPHFEKMLYDNALLVRLGAHTWQATHDDDVRIVVEETVAWLEREMTSPQGGFYSSLDADSEGEEGKFYVWTERELDKHLGSDSMAVKHYYGATTGGNFEGSNILHVRTERRMAASLAGINAQLFDRIIDDAKKTLYEVRSKRVWPGRDEKILASWNGLMLRGLATAARVLGRADMKRLALRNGEFLLKEMVRSDRVMRSHKDGRTTIPGFLEDYAAVALGFLSLYELTFDVKWVQRAEAIARSMMHWFWDEEVRAFFDTAHDAERLITRPRDTTDNAVPSGTSLAVDLLASLAELRNDDEMRRRATYVLESQAMQLIQHPSAFGHMLGAADMAVNGAVEVAIAGDPEDKRFTELERVVAAHYVPSLILAGGKDASGGITLLEGRQARRGKATAYVCRAYTCDEPVSDPKQLGTQLEKAGRMPDPPSY